MKEGKIKKLIRYALPNKQYTPPNSFGSEIPENINQINLENIRRVEKILDEATQDFVENVTSEGDYTKDEWFKRWFGSNEIKER